MKYSAIILIFCFLAGCRDYGTEGGNPQISHGSGMANTFAVANLLCQKRLSCLGVDDQNCQSEINIQTEITNELRINPPYRNLLELGVAEENEEVKIAIVALNTCSQSIVELNCADELAQESLNSTSYENVHLILRASQACAEIFETKR